MIQEKRWTLTPEQGNFIRQKYKAFSRRNKSSKTRNSAEITKNSVRVAIYENILAETNAFEMHLTDEKI
jgi:peptidyl-dipeptidase Dcp